MNRTTTAVFLAATFALCTAVLAAETQFRTHKIDLTDIEELIVEGAVGTIEITPTTGTELVVELEIESKRSGWFGRYRDIGDIDIESHQRGDRLFLEINEKDLDDVELHWHISLPEVARTSINLGVGQIIAEVGNTELRVELGVGDAKISANGNHAGRVEAHAGVGSATISGAKDVVTRRAFVSETVYGYGNSVKEIDVQVGVGEASVMLSSY